MIYRHTQVGMIGPAAFTVLALLFLAALVGAPETSIPAIAGFTLFFLILGAVLVNFSRLTVTVDEEAVTAAFGRGWPQREITIDDIVGCGEVRNRWLDGFGIRVTTNGLLYNVWGLDAVEVHLRNTERFRIGTDEPAELRAAIDRARTEHQDRSST